MRMTMTTIVVVMRMAVTMAVVVIMTLIVAVLRHLSHEFRTHRRPGRIEMPMDAGVRMAMQMPTMAMNESAHRCNLAPPRL